MSIQTPPNEDSPSPSLLLENLLASSARGASFLITLQIGSRALTFLVNQILLRHLSPELLGISAQLELYSSTVLFLARESLRVASLRYAGGGGLDEERRSERNRKSRRDVKREREGKRKGDIGGDGAGRRLQDIVNVSYIAIALGPLLAYGFGMGYLNGADEVVLRVPYFRTVLGLYAVATVIELLSEPCFMVAQHQMLYGVRASAEASATFARCIMNCSAAIWASRSGLDIGILPFAVGQMAYASVLLTVYHGGIWRQASRQDFTFVPSSINRDPSQYLFSLFPYPILSFVTNLYGQSVLKHILTQGDAFLSAWCTSTTAQGAFALASNYGSLLARMVFQPIEESSRGVFSRLLGSSDSSSSSGVSQKDSCEKSLLKEGKAGDSQVSLARTYLVTILRLYSLLSTFIVCIGPTLAPLLLGLIAGRQWAATSAASVLSLYCYYVPLLAVNGILEAFVSSVASPKVLQTQSAWMLGFSVGFAVASYVLLRVYELGAHGLVWANGVNILMRILWSGRFVRGYFDQRGVPLGSAAMPRLETIIIGLGAAWALRSSVGGLNGLVWNLIRVGSITAAYGVIMLALERRFLMNCYHLLRPGRTLTTENKKDL